MFFFFFDNKIEVKLGSSPNEADLAIVSIDEDGTVGDLNQMVLDEYGFNSSILRNVDIRRGFGNYEGENNNLILFVVTIDRNSTESNLAFNLLNCLENYSDVIQNKKVWIPLMGTGAGGLSLQYSYSITKRVIEQFFEKYNNLNCHFLISIPNSNDGKILYNQIEKESNKSRIDQTEFSSKSNLFFDENVFKLIKTSKYRFYLVGSNWDSQGDQSKRFYEEGIWENGYGEDKFGSRVNKIEEGDILFNKSTYAKHDGSSYLQIKGIAIVTQNPQNSSRVYCNWIIKNIKIDIKDLSNYRDTISEPSEEALIKILSSLDSNFLSGILRHIVRDKNVLTEESNEDDEQEDLDKPEPKTIVTTLAGLISDSDSGTDYLEITKDVNAFARVMAAKSFEPPLAIALLGKWGSGKSFFMRKLKNGIQRLSQINPEEQFCEGIAHVHFNAWSYMDANLWASIVTRIFEGLHDYINQDDLAKQSVKQIEKQLSQNLNITKEEIAALESQKENIESQLNGLEGKKESIQQELNEKIRKIKSRSIKEVIDQTDKEFKVTTKIQTALNENQSFIESIEKFKKIVPESYWGQPAEIYKQLKSSKAFVKSFFYGKNFWINWLFLAIIIAIITITPIFTYLSSLLISWHDFSKLDWVAIAVAGSLLTRAIDTYTKLVKLISPFWKIKMDYEKEKEDALFKFNQEEKALLLEIENNRTKINIIVEQIGKLSTLKSNIEFKLENAISTEALYSFIERRANSDDYKKHLGVVSLIRKDFEVLSGLMTQHHSEIVSNKDSKEFRELFSKPLERIILYIDDLDRCPEERVVEVLEAVNLLMAFPLFVVVVGVDPRWVKTALQKKYKNQFSEDTQNENAISPANYLEKIFQVPFHLKDAGDESIKGMIKTLAQIKPNIISSKSFGDYASNDYDSNDYDTGNIEEQPTHDEIEEILKSESITTTSLLNKETIEALNITEKECELLQNMSKIIGNNPRAIKRFVNIYRIVKTHEDFGFNNEETKDVELAVIMFLLALPMGNYKNLIPSFEYFLDGNMTTGFETLDHFLNSDYLSEIFKDADLLQDKRKEVYYLLSDYPDLLNQNVDILNLHYQFIKRFTFKNI